MTNKSELETLVSEIKKSTKQISINKVDEVRVMRSMLNDSEFTIGVYDRAQGYVGQKCPHNDAVKFVGLGEGEEDLEVFDIDKYIYGLFKDMM